MGLQLRTTSDRSRPFWKLLAGSVQLSGHGAFAISVKVPGGSTEDNDESVLPTYWNLFDFPAASCGSIALSFAMPTDSQPGDAASIQITAQPLAPQSATLGYGQIRKLEATLDGHPWSLENVASNTDDKIAINGVASCSTPSGY